MPRKFDSTGNKEYTQAPKSVMIKKRKIRYKGGLASEQPKNKKTYVGLDTFKVNSVFEGFLKLILTYNCQGKQRCDDGKVRL